MGCFCPQDLSTGHRGISLPDIAETRRRRRVAVVPEARFRYSKGAVVQAGWILADRDGLDGAQMDQETTSFCTA